MLEGLDRRSQGEFPDVGLRLLSVRESVPQHCLSVLIQEASVTDGSLAGDNDLTLFVGGQGFVRKLVFPYDGITFPV